MIGAFAMFLLFIIGIVLVVCNIWIIIEAFSESIIWGLLAFFFPLAQLVFVFLHWDRVKTPALTTLLCFPALIVVYGMAAIAG